MFTTISISLWLCIMGSVVIGLAGFTFGRLYRRGWGMKALVVILYPLRPIARPILNRIAKRLQPRWDAQAKAERQEQIRGLRNRSW